MATQEIINVGVLPNDGTGDPLRVAFEKINNNFTSLFSTSYNTSNTFTIGNTSNQVIFETFANTFTQGIFQIRSSDPGTPDSQDIIISAQKTNDTTNVKFTAYATTFAGNAVCRYDMDIFCGNVRILCNPLTSATLSHFISSQITLIGPELPGLMIQLDGYPIGQILSTENADPIITEGI